MASLASLASLATVLPSEVSGVLSGLVILGTLNWAVTGINDIQSISEFYGADEEAWKQSSELFCEILSQEGIEYRELCDRASVLEKFFHFRKGPQFSSEALDFVLSDKFYTDYKSWALQQNLDLVHLPENESSLKDMLEACDKKGITIDEAMVHLIEFDFFVGRAMRENLGLTPEMLYQTLGIFGKFPAIKQDLFAKKLASYNGNPEVFIGLQEISREVVRELEENFSQVCLPYRIVMNEKCDTGIVVHESLIGKFTWVELPKECGDTCAILFRGVLYVSVHLTSKKKDLSKPGQKNFEDQYEKLVEFCKSYPSFVWLGDFNHDITPKHGGFAYAFPKCDDEDTVRKQRSCLQIQHKKANFNDVMKKDFILVSCPGIQVEIVSQSVSILGDPSVVSKDAYLPHSQHPMDHLYVSTTVIATNATTASKAITTGACDAVDTAP
jgi:hypothetical protein